MSIALAIEKNGELILAADTLTSFGHTKVPPVLHAAIKEYQCKKDGDQSGCNKSGAAEAPKPA